MSRLKLQAALGNAFRASLDRHRITRCSEWAKTYRVMGNPYPGPVRFTYHPWTREMHDATTEINVGMKATQLGFTDTALNIAFYMIDIMRWSVLYVLPTKTPDATEFTAARFDPALELSPYLSEMFSDVSNVGHKRAGSVNLYIRGSRSRSGLKSVPAPGLILDEVDEMTQENIPLAIERTSGQPARRIWMISNPTIPGRGISKYWETSNKQIFVFKCPKCGRLTDLRFPQSLVVTADHVADPAVERSHLICHLCKGVLEHETKPLWLSEAYWQPTTRSTYSTGFGLSQLYSCQVDPVRLAKLFLLSQNDQLSEQKFYNNNIGVPHTVEGAKITDSNLAKCLTDHRQAPMPPSTSTYMITMGVDVGSWFHVEVDLWRVNSLNGDPHPLSQCRVLLATKVKSIEEIDMIMKEYQVIHAVIDANPERRVATDYCRRFSGRAHMCLYGKEISGKDIRKNDMMCFVDRSSWLELALSRFRTTSIRLPSDISIEYKEHVKSPAKVYDVDKHGDRVVKFLSAGDDHFAHARTYAEIALSLATGHGTVQTIGEQVV